MVQIGGARDGGAMAGLWWRGRRGVVELPPCLIGLTALSGLVKKACGRGELTALSGLRRARVKRYGGGVEACCGSLRGIAMQPGAGEGGALGCAPCMPLAARWPSAPCPAIPHSRLPVDGWIRKRLLAVARTIALHHLLAQTESSANTRCAACAPCTAAAAVCLRARWRMPRLALAAGPPRPMACRVVTGKWARPPRARQVHRRTHATRR